MPKVKDAPDAARQNRRPSKPADDPKAFTVHLGGKPYAVDPMMLSDADDLAIYRGCGLTFGEIQKLLGEAIVADRMPPLFAFTAFVLLARRQAGEQVDWSDIEGTIDARFVASMSDAAEGDGDPKDQPG